MTSRIVSKIKQGRAMVSKDTARYQYRAYSHKTCDACVMFHSNGTCDKVRGSISPKGTCKFWEAKHG